VRGRPGTTLLSVGNSEGERRCDARCYNADGSECDCVCGGRNHGVGERQAVDNTRELGEQWLAEIATREGKSVAALKAEIFGQPAGGALL